MLAHSMSSRFIALGIFLFALPIALAEDPKPDDPRADIATMIPHAIQVLEAKEYVRFIKELASPTSLKRLETKPGGIEDAAKQYETSAGPVILNILKNMGNQKPVISADGKRAIFRAKGTKGGYQITLIRSGDYWYFADSMGK
jgi:hypothetical protein